MRDFVWSIIWSAIDNIIKPLPKPMADAVGDVPRSKRNADTKRERLNVRYWRKAYGFQPADETFGTVTHASLYGKIVVLDIECALTNKTRLGVFEVPIRAFRQYRHNKRFQFDDVRQLIGRQVVLCIHGRYNFKGYYRSNVHGVKVFSKEASVARKAAAQEVIDPQNSGDENFDPVVAAGLAVA